MKKLITIECCYINRLNGSDKLFSELEKNEHVQVVTFNCIGNCTVCSEKYHCVVDGVRYVEDSIESLKKHIEYILEKK